MRNPTNILGMSSIITELNAKIEAQNEQISKQEGVVETEKDKLEKMRRKLYWLNRELEILSKIKLEEMEIDWGPAHLVADLPITGYSKSILSQSGIVETRDIPVLEQLLMIRGPKIGFAVIEDLKLASHGTWPISTE